MKVAIAGYGQEGEANYRYWQALGAQIAIFDEKEPTCEVPEDVEAHIGPEVFSDLKGFDLVIRTAGLSPEKITTDGKIWSATNEFFKQCTTQIIGVTGTKGKGTTASLIVEILQAAGKTVHLVGNIGLPALSLLSKIEPEDIVVFELSSFQLWDLEKSPQTAVILMIEADHMDVHTSMEQYIRAKANIGIHQTPEDLLIFHPENTYSAEVASLSPAQKRRYCTPEGAYIAKPDPTLKIEGNVICSTAEVGLLGEHNLENICAAITASWKYTQNIDAIRRAVTAFKGLPHRLQAVYERDGVVYVDDSFSSAPGATVAAIKSFTQPEILICGGFDRGLDYTELAQSIVEQQNIKKVVLMGQTASSIAGSLDSVLFKQYELCESTNFSEVIGIAQSYVEAGDVVLLSPGCASFDMFQNFKQRGEQFAQIVRSS